jgi:hypothetical protein
MFGKNKTPQKTDFDKITEIFEDRFWYGEQPEEDPFTTIFHFSIGNPAYNDFYMYRKTVDRNTTLEELRDNLIGCAQRAREFDESDYDINKGPTAMMQLSDELDSIVVELDRAIAEKTQSRAHTR